MSSVFLFLPRKTPEDKKIYYGELLIFQQELSFNVQQIKPQKEKADTTRTGIQNKVKGFKLPEDVRKSLKVANPEPEENLKGQEHHNDIPAGSPVEKSYGGSAEMAKKNTAPLQSMPRLIYEEVPSSGKNKFKGMLQLSLKINENGQVVDHRLLSNSLDCTDCLNAIIRAAYKSRWEPAIVDGKEADFWVEKSYTFK